MAKLLLFGLVLSASWKVWGACGQCAESALGGPADNRFTPFESVVAAGGTLPEILVNAASLNLYLRTADLRIGGARGFSLERSYNLDDDRAGAFGNKWSFNLGESLTPDAERRYWTLRRGSGRLDMFAAGAEAGRFFPAGRTSLELVQSATGYIVRGGGATRTFRADGRLAAIDQNGFQVALEYDAAGRLMVARGAGRTIQFAYQPNGYVAGVTDSAGRGLEYGYNAEGYLTQQTNADGTTTRYEYDGAGRLTAVRTGADAVLIAYGEPAGIRITLPDGAVRTFEAGRGPREIRAGTGEGGPSSVYASSPVGLVESVTGAAGNRVTYAYDAAGRRTRTINAAGDTVRYEYDAAGNLTAVVLPGGARWSAEYDSAGMPVRIADPRGNAWRYGYQNGLLTSVADPLGAPSAVTRSAQGLVDAFTDANFNTSTFQHGADGLLMRWTDALGMVRSYEYDGAARPISRTDPDGAVVRAAPAGSAVERDAAGRAVQSRGARYSYDAAGRLAAIRLAAGEISYEYDAAGRLSKVGDWQGNFALYRYAPDGALQSVNVSGGPMTVYQYDAAHNLRAVVGTGPDGAVIAAYRYSRDAAGNALSVAALEPLAAAPPAVASSATYDAANRLLSRDDGVTLRYDARGLLSKAEGPLAGAFSWDAFGRLAAFNGAEYSYDASGLRSQRAAAGAARRYDYDHSGPRPRLLIESDASGAVAYYVWGLGPLWKLDASGKAYFFHLDGEGNVVALSNPAAGVVNRYRYDALGRLAAAEETIENRLRSRAENGWIDDGDGMIYTGAAYHLPQLGVTLNGTASVEPPVPNLLPALRAPGALLLSGGPR